MNVILNDDPLIILQSGQPLLGGCSFFVCFVIEKNDSIEKVTENFHKIGEIYANLMYNTS